MTTDPRVLNALQQILAQEEGQRVSPVWINGVLFTFDRALISMGAAGLPAPTDVAPPALSIPEPPA